MGNMLPANAISVSKPDAAHASVVESSLVRTGEKMLPDLNGCGNTSAASPCGLLRLPAEILIEIGKNLSYPNLFAISKTCRALSLLPSEPVIAIANSDPKALEAFINRAGRDQQERTPMMRLLDAVRCHPFCCPLEDVLTKDIPLGAFKGFDQDGENILHYAVRMQNPQVLKKIFEMCPPLLTYIDRPSKDDSTPLENALDCNDEIFNALTEMDINAISSAYEKHPLGKSFGEWNKYGLLVRRKVVVKKSIKMLRGMAPSRLLKTVAPIFDKGTFIPYGGWVDWAMKSYPSAQQQRDAVWAMANAIGPVALSQEAIGGFVARPAVRHNNLLMLNELCETYPEGKWLRGNPFCSPVAVDAIKPKGEDIFQDLISRTGGKASSYVDKRNKGVLSRLAEISSKHELAIELLKNERYRACLNKGDCRNALAKCLEKILSKSSARWGRVETGVRLVKALLGLPTGTFDLKTNVPGKMIHMMGESGLVRTSHSMLDDLERLPGIWEEARNAGYVQGDLGMKEIRELTEIQLCPQAATEVRRAP